MILVPESGRGEVRQLSVSPRGLRRAALAALAGVGALVAALVFSLGRLPASGEADALRARNVSLTDRLAQVEARVAALEPLVARVRAYDDKLRSLESHGSLPGFGPLDEAEMAARQAWIDGVLALPTDGAYRAGIEARLGALEDDLTALSPGLVNFEQILARFDGLLTVLPAIWPVEGTLTSPFGSRRSPFTRRWTMHTGLDLGAQYGSPILATNDGLVTYVGWDSGHGNSVHVDHGEEVTTRYHHASRVLVSEGEMVAVGDVIALVGSTGMSTGPHLHFELVIAGEKVDPLTYLP